MLPTSHGCWESALVFVESPFDCLNAQVWLCLLVWITWLQTFHWLKPVFVCSIFTFQVRANFFCGYNCRASVYGAPTKKKMKNRKYRWTTSRRRCLIGWSPHYGWSPEIPKTSPWSTIFRCKPPFFGVKNRKMLDNHKKGKSEPWLITPMVIQSWNTITFPEKLACM